MLQKLDKNGKALIGAYDLYAEKLYRYVFLRTSSKETAEDIVSNVFLKTWDYLQKENSSIKNYRAFLYRVAHNLIVDYYKEKSKRPISLENLTQSHLPSSDINYQEISHNKLEMEKIKEAMKKLNGVMI